MFDKQRSRQYRQVQSITVYLSADHPDNIRGIDLEIASFDYNDLKENLFKDNPDAIWYNPSNEMEHLNLADAFELQLFHGSLIKVSNPHEIAGYNNTTHPLRVSIVSRHSFHNHDDTKLYSCCHYNHDDE